MRADDQGAFEMGNGDAVVLTVDLWASGDGVHLRIDTAGDGANTSLTNGPGSAKGQRVLFRDLKRLLMADGCWVPGDEGDDSQAGGSSEN